MKTDNRLIFVAFLAGRYETVELVRKAFGTPKKKVNYEKLFKMVSDKAFELMADPKASPFFAKSDTRKIK